MIIKLDFFTVPAPKLGRTPANPGMFTCLL